MTVILLSLLCTVLRCLPGSCALLYLYVLLYVPFTTAYGTFTTFDTFTLAEQTREGGVVTVTSRDEITQRANIYRLWDLSLYPIVYGIYRLWEFVRCDVDILFIGSKLMSNELVSNELVRWVSIASLVAN